MNYRYLFVLIFLWHFCVVSGQQKKDMFVLGFAYGAGEELENPDYGYTNSIYIVHFE